MKIDEDIVQPLVDKIKWTVDTTGRDPKRSEFHRGWHAACQMILAVINADIMHHEPRPLEVGEASMNDL